MAGIYFSFMNFRRAIAVFFTFLFVLTSLLMFLTAAMTNTFLKTSFYQGKVREGAYDFLVKVATYRIRENDELLALYFNDAKLKAEITNVFTQELFNTMSDHIGQQIQKLKENPRSPVTISLKLFRESLLTVAHNLSYELFQSLPVCIEDQVPETTTSGLPTCVPEGAEYNDASASLAARFEKAIYAAMPEQVQSDLTSSEASGNVILILLIGSIETIKYTLYFILLYLAVMIALLVYKPFAAILKYEGFAFALSGILGYCLSLVFAVLPRYVLTASSQTDVMYSYVQQFTEYLFTFGSFEIQKIAVIFLAFGGILILLQVFLRRRV